ncbi:membrane protein [Hydrogenimonas sp.]|nr:membrane protein [Hydrogenimonas sp.]
MHHDKKEVLNKGLVSFAIKVAGLALGFVLTFYLAKKFGPLGTGIFATTMTFLQVLSIFTKFGTDGYLLREISKSRQLQQGTADLFREISLIVLVFSLIVSIVLFVLNSQILQKLFHGNLNKDTFIFIIFSYILYTLLTLNFTFLKAIREIALQSFFNYMSLFLFMLLMLVLHKSSYEADAIVKIIFVAIAMSFLFSLVAIYAKSEKGLSPSVKKIFITHKRIKKIFKLSVPFLLTSALMLIMNWIDTIMIASLVSSEAVGVYYIVAKFSMIVTLPSVALCNILAPKFSAAFNEKFFSKINDLIRWAFGKVAMTSLLIFLAFVLFGEWMLEFYGNDFKEGYSSLLFLSGGQLLNSFVGVVAALFLVAHYEKKFAFIMLLASIINILLNLLLIPLFEILGASIASFCSFVFLFFSSLYIYIKRFRLYHA